MFYEEWFFDGIMDRSLPHLINFLSQGRETSRRPSIPLALTRLASNSRLGAIDNTSSNVMNGTRKRRRRLEPNYQISPWWIMLSNPDIRDPLTPAGKKFRLRFRVPFVLFQELLSIALSLGFKAKPVNASGIEGIPLELQVLGIRISINYITIAILYLYYNVYGS